ncbi:uncharacterized protein LOC111331841 [Stylophora pistillata]|uniref:uncharacterized protein LOC111331841 n=1 Tax=Stylophora pistillata TaxID=50429 RepID=UPI000C051C5E|nr:uncharacterized protein LOC111331841 [Stylophora pistillata]
MEGFQKNVYLLTEDETRTLTLSEIAGLRKGERYKRRVTFRQDMTDGDVRGLFENLFRPILSNKRFSCASREGQTSDLLNFHGEHRVWDGRMIKRYIKGQSALYLVMEDKPVLNLVSSTAGPPSSLQGHSSSTSFFQNSKNGQIVSLSQTQQSVTTVTSINTRNPTGFLWDEDLYNSGDNQPGFVAQPLVAGVDSKTSSLDSNELTGNSVDYSFLNNQDNPASHLKCSSEPQLKPVSNLVLPAAGGPPLSLQGYSSSTMASCCRNSKNGRNVSLMQTRQSTTTGTFMNATNPTENSVEWEQWDPWEWGNFTTSNKLDDNLNVPFLPDFDLENIVEAMDFGEHTEPFETIPWASFWINGNQEQSELQSQIPSSSTDAFQSDDSAFSSLEETVSQNGIFNAHGTTQGCGVTKPNRKRNKLMGKDRLPNYVRDSSGQSDSGISSEASTCQAETLNRPKPLRVQEARMKPSEGPLQGGGIFRAEIDEELPPLMATAWASFGNRSEKVRVTRDGLAMFGEEIPRGDAPGPVTVTFTTLNGDYVAKAIFTYKKFENSTTEQTTRAKRFLDEVEESVKRLRSVTDYESDEFAEENNQELVVTQVVEDQPVEEGYFGDAETSDAEEASED